MYKVTFVFEDKESLEQECSSLKDLLQEIDMQYDFASLTNLMIKSFSFEKLK